MAAICWTRALDRAIRRVCGPEDEPDEAVNGDPDSLTGEDDESGFDDMPGELGWADEQLGDDGFDDAAGDDDDEEGGDDDDEEGGDDGDEADEEEE